MSERSLSILIVEDNPVNQLYLKTLLVRSGHFVHIANDGAEAIEEFARSLASSENRFDLIFMDLQMPGTDGFEASAKIRELEANAPSHHKKTSISALSAYPLRDETEREELKYFDYYLTKPVTKQQIEEALATLSNHPETDFVQASTEESKPAETTIEDRIEPYMKKLLKEFGDDHEELREMLQLALKEIPHKLSELNFYFKNRDQNKSCEAAHALANVIGVFYAPTEREIALSLEKLCRTGEWETARAAYLQLQDRAELLLQSYSLLLNRELNR